MEGDGGICMGGCDGSADEAGASAVSCDRFDSINSIRSTSI